MEQEPSDIRDLVERITEVPQLRKQAPSGYFRKETFKRSPLMTYCLEEVRRMKVGDSL
jgi:hypothetical protein